MKNQKIECIYKGGSELNEKRCVWTNEKCEECGGWILYDLSKEEKFCEKCGLVVCEKRI